jgi:hypothetical protein
VWDYCYKEDFSPKMVIEATNVNKSSVNPAHWSITKSFTVTMTESSPNTIATSDVLVTVVPCAVTAVPAISKLETDVGSTATLTHSAALVAYTNPESNLTHCGAITYELIGTVSGLTYDSSTRTLTFAPTAISSEQTFQIRAKSTDFPLNYTDSPFKIEGKSPCTGILGVTIPNVEAGIGD